MTSASPAAWPWTVAGGDVGVRWNHELLAELGLPVLDTNAATPVRDATRTPRIALDPNSRLTLQLRSGTLAGFSSGQLRALGGYRLGSAGDFLDLSNFVLRPVAGASNDLDLVGSDGKAWLRLIRAMSEFSDDRRGFDIATMDVTISEALAQRVGRPETAGWTVGDLGISTTTTSLPAPVQPTAVFNWPGDPAPNGGTYQADLFMKALSFQYMRCDSCTGPGGNGRIVFAPTSTLRNNANTGTVQVWTVGGGSDPLGTSSAMWPAGIAWYAKFSGIFPPYDNDQHPYLIWNMYRYNADGSIQQIGRSGAKHAFLTLNTNCSGENDYDPHVLGRGCEDRYTMSHNDYGDALSPRSEIIAATGQWGRCYSVYDPSCSGQESPSGYGSYDQRMVVGESEISDFLHPGASYRMESWYLARDDINIYNSMATVLVVPEYMPPLPPSQGGWNVNNESQFRLGPAIDRWVEPSNPGSNAVNIELVTPEGHLKVAMKAVYVGFQGWRYDYAFANMDFARAHVHGSEPNLDVETNEGIREIRIPIPTAGVVSTRFVDADSDPGNNWTVTQSNGELVFSAPEGNRLDWGSLYSASFVSEAAPVISSVTMVVAEPGTPTSYNADGVLAPRAGDSLFKSGFD